ncbi:MAG: tetratricopeptide repeat protein [Pseudomonadota bacterium]
MLCAAAAQARISVLDHVDVTHAEGYSTVRLYMNVPMQVKRFAPERSGDFIRIFVEPVATLGAEADVLFGDETIQWSADEEVPLTEISYESSGFATAIVNLQFEEEVEFEIPPSPDLRQIAITVRHKGAAVPDVREPVMRGGEAGAAARTFSYAINLASSMQPFTAAELPELDILQVYRVYTTEFQKDGKPWSRLRLGFFSSKEEAEQVLQQIGPYFPGAWLTRVSPEEREESAATAMDGSTARVSARRAEPAPPPEPSPAARVGGRVTASELEKMGEVMAEAERLMTDKDYDGAIRLYTKVLDYPENASSRDALEYLGLARERKGQLAQAKAAYDSYLERYPEGEGADRVKQRLAGLVTATKAPKGKLQAAKGRETTGAEWDVFGGFSQFYRRDENTSQLNEDEKLTTVTQSSLSSDLDITGRLKTGDYELRTRFAGGYLYDFLNSGEDSETTVSSLYFDATNRNNRLAMRLGRQSRSTGGVLGRFDGLLLDVPLTRKLSMAATTGFPVDSSRDGFDSSQYFYGVNFELEDFLEGWDASAFYIEQKADTILDRRAVGGELRYFDVNRSFFTLVDYDIFYQIVNTAQLLGNWTTASKTTFNIVLDYRNSPILTTSNALQGALNPNDNITPLTTIEEMLVFFTQDELFQFAQDRTATARLGTLGVSRPITEKLQVSGDVTLSKLSDTVSSGGVAVVPGTDNEFYYNLQLIGSNLLKEGDVTIIGLRFIDATTSDTTSLSLNTRYPVTRDFRVNPRFRVDFRKNDDNTEQFIYRPSARLTYSIKRRFRLEGELGGEWSDREIVAGSSKSKSWFVNLGYRADF